MDRVMDRLERGLAEQRRAALPLTWAVGVACLAAIPPVWAWERVAGRARRRRMVRRLRQHYTEAQ